MLQLELTTVGNSTGLVLSKEALARLKVKKGDIVFLVEPSTSYELTPFDPEFASQMELAEKRPRDYRNALRELSNK